jgi:hypothetical protein
MANGEVLGEFGDSFPRDPEAVAAAASDALRLARTDREILLRIEAGETDWQRNVMARLERIDANLETLVQHCKGRTTACNEAASIHPLPRRRRTK